jgi:cell division protein FtsB
MAKKRPLMVKLSRAEARTQAFDAVRRMVFVVFCAAAGFVCVAMAKPQRDKLAEVEERLKEAQRREIIAMADRENLKTEHRALREDPAFLEMHARDRLGRYREGERVLKFSRAQ